MQAIDEGNEARAPATRLPSSAIARAIALSLVAASLAAVLTSSAVTPIDRPNIVLVVGDDHGFRHSGFMGDPIAQTPNLDRLAAGGVVFTTAYVTASVCEPSLRSLLTGSEPFSRHPRSFPAPTPPARTLPGILARHGYGTFQAGKLWQSSYDRIGFGEGTKGRNADGSRFERAMGGSSGLAVGRSTMRPVLDFIDRNLRRPFFVFFAPMLPHRPWNASAEQRARYRSVARELSPSALAYYANVSRLDDALGELVGHLDRRGLRSRTLVVYLADNGFRQEPDETFSPDVLDHAKGSMAEMGFRTPLVFNWPGRLSGAVVRDDLVSSLDLFPTLLDFAGVPPLGKTAGVDLRPALERGVAVGRSEIVGVMLRARPVSVGKPPRRPVPRAYFVRSARWHYVHYPDLDGAAADQLFDLESDPSELHDVADRRPDRVADFRARIARWQAEAAGEGVPVRP